MDYDDDNEEEGEDKEQGTWRQLSNMALTSLECNEIWLKNNNTLGLSIHRVIHYKKAYLCFDAHIKYYMP